MLINGVRAFAGVVLSGLAVGLPVGLLTGGKGTPMLTAGIGNRGQGGMGFKLASEDPKNLQTGGGTGLKVGETVRFSDKLGIKFGKYTLKSGDKLCSPDHDYNFFLMSWNGKDGYTVEGQKGTQFTCKRYKDSKPETVKLEGMRGSTTTHGSGSVSSIELSTCFFTLNKTEIDKRYRITISNCKTNRGQWAETVTTASWVADYK